MKKRKVSNRTVVKTKVMWSEISNKCYLATKYSDGSICCEEISTEEAAKLQDY